MGRLLYEFDESVRIAFAQLRAHKLRSLLTALGVIIGIVAVTLMGTAIHGMDLTFERSLALLGNDVLYVDKWPWTDVDDWWNYVNRPPIHPERDARELNRIIAGSDDSLLEFAVPVSARSLTVNNGRNSVDAVYANGASAEKAQLMTADFDRGRFYDEGEADSGRAVVVLGYDLAKALFPDGGALGGTVTIQGHPFTVIGVLTHQGSFLGLFSWDNQVFVPLKAFRKYISSRDRNTELEVRVRDPKQLDAATEELIGAMRRVRGLGPGEPDNFTINQQQAFRQQLDPTRRVIAFAGFFVTGLALFVGAIGIMNITFVSVKERTREIGTRKALGARRRTILLQFIIESASVSLIGGIVGIGITLGLAAAVARAMPTLPVEFSPLLIVSGLVISVGTGIAAGFAPAWGASRLDPVEALRYE